MRRNIVILVCLINQFLGLLVAQNENVVLRSRDSGMFSIFFDVLALLKQYEKGKFESIEVDFHDTGLYYSTEQGFNWWSYYFEPIKYGSGDGTPVPFYGMQLGVKPGDIEFRTSKVEANKLINRHVKVKQFILNEVVTFTRDHFKDHFVIGIHYRGTDKICEAKRVSYQYVDEKLQKILQFHNTDDFMIFIATDEQEFINYMSSLYPDRVCWVMEAERSTNGLPLHQGNDIDPYLAGKYALIDCLLLSKTDYLLRTSSNLSLASTYFNPTLPVLEISQRRR